MPVENSTVYVVDDDPDLRETLGVMVRSMGLEPKTYPSAEEFLDGYRDGSVGPRCMVLDVCMPGLSGLGLQEMLLAQGVRIPIIMVSGCADVPSAVKAMNAGALDFLEKPVSPRTLSVRIREAIDHDVRQRRRATHKTDLTRLVESLSARQREVFDLLVSGATSKQIAKQLGIGEKTVAKHRAIVLEKMQVESVVDLVRLFADTTLPPQGGQPSLQHCN
jgi:two-component system, LuxR family, response regulator FixJ